MKIKQIIIAAFIFVMIPAGFAFAHKVIVFAWIEDGMIHTQSSFGSKRKAKDCVIIVVDEKNQVIHKGLSDKEGNYSFEIPEIINSDLIIKLDAGSGHKAQWKLSKNELVTIPSTKDIQKAMKEKQSLEENPSILKIITGIGIIFILAMAAKFLKRKISPK